MRIIDGGQNTNNNVVSFLKRNVEKHPNKVAFYYVPKNSGDSSVLEHKSVTYREFDEMTSRFAYGLKKQGVEFSDRVIVFVSLSVDLYVSVVALQYIGAIPVLLDSVAREDQMKSIVENSKPCAVTAPELWLHSAKEKLDMFDIGLRVAIDGNSNTEEVLSFSSLVSGDMTEVLPVKLDDTALLTYTTGSSGTPKGVNRTHSFLAEQHYALKRLFPYEDDAIDLPVFPVFALNNIASGITTVIPAVNVSNPNSETPQTILSQIRSCGVNNMTLSPSSFLELARYCEENNIVLEHIKRILTGGAPISELDIKQFMQVSPNSKNWILYGSTEVEPISIIESREMLSVETCDDMNVTKIGVNVGRVDEALQFRFIDVDTGQIQDAVDVSDLEVSKGEVGELIVAGDHVCQEYYKNESAFVRAKIRDEDGTVWHRTGDLAREDKNGYLWVVGRKHNVINYKGEYFFPVRPEIILKNLPNVVNAAYIALEEDGRKKIVAVISLDIDDEKIKENVRKEILNVFAAETLPVDEVAFMSEIPMDVRHHSKVDYNSLRKKLYEMV